MYLMYFILKTNVNTVDTIVISKAWIEFLID